MIKAHMVCVRMLSHTETVIFDENADVFRKDKFIYSLVKDQRFNILEIQ